MALPNNPTPNEMVKAIKDLENSSSSVSIDNTSITKNSSDQIQTVGVIDQRTGNANKQWTGTKAEYDALGTHDANTFYNITDDNGGAGTQIVTLYDMSSSDSSINRGYTSGIGSSVSWIMDISEYKFIKIYYQMYFGAPYNTGGNCNILELGIDLTQEWNIAHSAPPYFDNGAQRNSQFAIFYRYKTDTKGNIVYFFNNGSEATTVSAYHIFRIEGVK